MEDHLGPAPVDELDHRRGSDVELVEAQLVAGLGPRRLQVGQRAGGEVVDDVDPVAFGQQPVDEVRADEPGSPGHHHSHRRPLPRSPVVIAAPSAGTRPPWRVSPGAHRGVVTDHRQRRQPGACAHDGAMRPRWSR